MTGPVSTTQTLLGPGDPEPVGTRNGDKASPFLMICDHAGSAVPEALAGLGLPPEELNRHIGIDIGILGVSERLSDLLGAPLVFQRYSRLAAESNRRFDSPDFLAPVSDGTPVPANRAPSASDRAARIREIVEPYHAEIERRIAAALQSGTAPILLSMHSFTPMLRAAPAPRPWHIGLCFHHDRRFTDPVLAELESQADILVGRNEPYGVNMIKDYSIPVHGEERGIPYVEFEIRQDLIGTATGQEAWAERLAGVLSRALHRYQGGVA